VVDRETMVMEKNESVRVQETDTATMKVQPPPDFNKPRDMQLHVSTLLHFTRKQQEKKFLCAL
jgi:hypothetical protein